MTSNNKCAKCPVNTYSPEFGVKCTKCPSTHPFTHGLTGQNSSKSCSACRPGEGYEPSITYFKKTSGRCTHYITSKEECKKYALSDPSKSFYDSYYSSSSYPPGCFADTSYYRWNTYSSSQSSRNCYTDSSYSCVCKDSAKTENKMICKTCDITLIFSHTSMT